MAYYAIRQAVAAEREALVTMACHFLELTPYGALFPPTPEALGVLVDRVLELQAEGQAAIFVADADVPADAFPLAGMIALVAGPHHLTGTPFVQELVWWVEPDHRRDGLGPQLLAVAEAWTTAKSVPMLQMVAPFDSVVGRFLEKSGYAPVEASYVKLFGRPTRDTPLELDSELVRQQQGAASGGIHGRHLSGRRQRTEEDRATPDGAGPGARRDGDGSVN